MLNILSNRPSSVSEQKYIARCKQFASYVHSTAIYIIQQRPFNCTVISYTVRVAVVFAEGRRAPMAPPPLGAFALQAPRPSDLLRWGCFLYFLIHFSPCTLVLCVYFIFVCITLSHKKTFCLST